MNKKKAKKYDTDMQRVKDNAQPDRDYKFELPEEWDVEPNSKEKRECDSCSG